MTYYKRINDLDLKAKKVFLRVDYNVPIQNGKVVDDYRIKASLPTIKKLLKSKVSQINICSHLGRPKGKVNNSLSLKPIAQILEKLLGEQVTFVNHLDKVDNSKIILRENIRFHEGEKNNSKELAKKLANLADVFVNDAFGVSHRKHSSVHATSALLSGGVGLLIEKELRVFEEVLQNPPKPFISILGGSKLNTKIPLIKNLEDKTEYVLLGGAMIFTLYKSQGLNIGKSMVDEDSLKIAKKFVGKKDVILPVDVNVAKNTESKSFETKNVDELSNDDIGLDLGPKTVDTYKKMLKKANLVVWNGPLGYYENEVFAKATYDLMKFLAKSNVKTVIGGGDTAAVVNKLNLRDEFYHVSTGGGASMTLLRGEELVALEHLKK